MVFLFRDKSISGIVLLFLLLLAVHFHILIIPTTVLLDNNNGLINILLAKYIAPLNSSVIFVLYIITVFVQALRLNIALNNFKMFQHQHQTVAMSYILATAFFTQWSQLSAALISNFLVIWIFLKLARLSVAQTPKTLLFNIGLIAGATILAYHPTYIIILVVFFALAIERSFKLVEWVVLLMGIILPFYFLGAWLYLSNQFHKINIYLPDIHFHLPIQQATIWLWLSISILGVILLASIYYNQANSVRMVIQIRKNWSVILILLILLLPVCFVFGNTSIEASALSLIPIAALAGNVFSYPKRLLFPNLLFWLSILIAICNNLLITGKLH